MFDAMLMHAASADHSEACASCILHCSQCAYALCFLNQYTINSAVRAVQDKPVSLRCALRASIVDFASHLPMLSHLVQALYPSPSRGANCQCDVVETSDALDRGREISAAAATRSCSGVVSAGKLWCFRHMHMHIGKRTYRRCATGCVVRQDS